MPGILSSALKNALARGRSVCVAVIPGLVATTPAIFLASMPAPANAQQVLAGGDAAVTQFSGLERSADGTPRPDPDGAVLRLLGLDSEDGFDGALRPPPRMLLTRTARDLGQVFAVAFGHGEPANIYVAASSAYGLYRTSDGEDWAEGMWGPEGEPGTIWKLDPERGYRAERLLDIGFLDEPNGGAGLGDLAYDPWHGQLFASDLETGLIHRIDPEDGALIESFDHGVDGRPRFFDAAAGEERQREPVMHDVTSAPRFLDCVVERDGEDVEADFESTPECWNFAHFQRRVWGLGVFGSDEDNIRLYYAVWGGAALGSDNWSAGGDDAMTSIWSIGLAEGGWFDATDVRREVILPALVEEEGAEPVETPPVTDIAFTADGAMIVAERNTPAPHFEQPDDSRLTGEHAARVLRLRPDAQGVWQVTGRYQAGYPLRDTMPEIRANAAGGVATGQDAETPLWMSVDPLCTDEMPCPSPTADSFAEKIAGLQAVHPDDYLAPDTETDAAGGMDRARVVTVRGAGRIPGDMGSVALHPGETSPVRIVTRPARAEEDIEAEEETRIRPGEVDDDPEPAVVPADIAVAVSGPEICGLEEECAFNVTLSNEGPDDFDAPLVITTTFGAADVAFIDAEPGDWACHTTNGHVFCNREAFALDQGDAQTLSLAARIPPDYWQAEVEACTAVTWLGRSGRDRIRVVQAELNRRDFEAGPVDGVMGPRTSGAITEFENAEGLRETGEIRADVVASLFGRGAWIAGDADAANDRGCARVAVDLPERTTQPPPDPSTGRSGDRARHHPIISRFHERRASSQHDPATSAPRPVHQRAMSQFHARYHSSLHDGRQSRARPRHDRVMSRFHQRFESRAHDPETSGRRRIHRPAESAYRDRMDPRFRTHDGWTSRWR